jgi:ABC-type phosphate transport system substrate-binding protein
VHALRMTIVLALRMRRACALGLVLAVAGLGATPVRADEVVVIVNKDNPNAVDVDFVRRIYTGSLRGWPDGSPVLAYDQSEDTEAREQFCAGVLRKSMANLKAIWSQNIFTGKGLPPRVASPDAEMKRAIASERNAIGYIRRSQLDDSVKVVAR